MREGFPAEVLESSTRGPIVVMVVYCVVDLWKRISGLQGPLLPSRLLPRMAPHSPI